MLFYLSLYLLAAVLVFQGTHLLGERTAPMGVVPAEVVPAALPASRWGGFLLGYGSMLLLITFLSHFYDWFFSALAPLRILGFLGMALYGFWLIFGRKVDYTPAPPAEGAAHGHH